MKPLMNEEGFQLGFEMEQIANVHFGLGIEM